MAARGSQGGQLSLGPGAGRHGRPGLDAEGQAVSVRLRRVPTRLLLTAQRGHAERSGAGLGLQEQLGLHTEAPRPRPSVYVSGSQEQTGGRVPTTSSPAHATAEQSRRSVQDSGPARAGQSLCCGGERGAPCSPAQQVLRAAGRGRAGGAPSALFPRPASCRAAPPQAAPAGHSAAGTQRRASGGGDDFSQARPRSSPRCGLPYQLHGHRQPP